MKQSIQAIATVILLAVIIVGIKYIFFTKECEDTDGGDNIYVMGTIKGPKLTTGDEPADYCLSYAPGTLVEYSCSYEGGFSAGAVKSLFSKSVKCENGCLEGACVK